MCKKVGGGVKKMARHAIWDDACRDHRLLTMQLCSHSLEFNNVSDATKKLQEEWIKENCSGWWWSEDYLNWLMYNFSEESDAIHFKLRWG